MGKKSWKRKENADDDSIQTEDSTLAEVFDDLPETEKVEKNPAKNSRKRKLLQGATKESYLKEKEFALTTSLHEDIAEKTTKTSREKEEKSAEELFCSSLAAELKKLPEYDRCMAKTSYKTSFSNIK